MFHGTHARVLVVREVPAGGLLFELIVLALLQTVLRAVGVDLGQEFGTLALARHEATNVVLNRAKIYNILFANCILPMTRNLFPYIA